MTELPPGTRVYNQIFKHLGTLIVDEGEYAQCVWDDGQRSTIRKNCLIKVSDPHPAMAAIAKELHSERKMNRLLMRENGELSYNSKLESQQLDLAVQKIVELRGKERTMFSESAVLAELQKEVEDKNLIEDLKSYEENFDEEQGDILLKIVDQLNKELDQNEKIKDPNQSI